MDQQLEDDHTLSDYNILQNSLLTLLLGIKGGGKRARNKEESLNKDETIQNLTDELDTLTLQLSTSDIPRINQIVQNVNQQLQQMTAEQALASLSAENLNKLVSICASGNKAFKYESLTKMLMTQHLSDIAKKKKDLGAAETMLMKAVQLIFAKQFMLQNGTMLWASTEALSVSGCATSLISRGSYVAGHQAGSGATVAAAIPNQS